MLVSHPFEMVENDILGLFSAALISGLRIRLHTGPYQTSEAETYQEETPTRVIGYKDEAQINPQRLQLTTYYCTYKRNNSHYVNY